MIGNRKIANVSALPHLYAGWMDQVLPDKIPSESKATCDKCAMCAHGDERPGNSHLFFNPAAKCCTYLPELYNFLVGGILTDEDPALSQGRASVEARLEAKLEVTPFGLGQFPSYTLLYTHAHDAFGQSRNLRCPHYIEEEGGRCGIWRHRNSTCITWFCKHERGAIGLKFWRTLLQLLGRVEVGLSRWCVLELDLGTKALESLFARNLENRGKPILNTNQIDLVVDLKSYRLLWGRWAGRERQFYQECARLVSNLDWDDILSICGPEVLAFTKLTQEAYDQLTSTRVPEAVRLKPIQIVRMGTDSVLVQSYSPYDPLQVPRKLFDVLSHLEGQPIPEALQIIEKEKGLRLRESLVRKLIDFDILTEDSEDDSSNSTDNPEMMP